MTDNRDNEHIIHTASPERFSLNRYMKENAVQKQHGDLWRKGDFSEIVKRNSRKGETENGR